MVTIQLYDVDMYFCTMGHYTVLGREHSRYYSDDTTYAVQDINVTTFQKRSISTTL